MARHDLVPLTVAEAGCELRVETTQLGCEIGGSLLAVQRGADSSRHLCEPARIEPDMRVGDIGLCAGHELLTGEEIERRAGATFDRLLERRLESVSEVEDEVSVADGLDIAGRELEVVRLRTGRRQIDDPSAGARDALSSPGERVEARHDGRSAVRVVAAPGHDDESGEEHDHTAHAVTVARL
jgi:hypothetical protein